MSGVTRRRLLGAGAGALAAGAAGAGTAAAQSDGGVDFDGWFDDVSNFDGVVDRRGEDTVEVTVGAEGNDGNYAFGPAAVRVDPGTTVVWRWNGEGGAHNVVAEGADWSSGDAVTEAGATYERTFESEGIHKYYCTPHEGLGMKGAVVVGGVGTAASQPLEWDGWFDDVSNFDGVVDERGSDTVEVTVGAEGNGGNLAFGPAAVRVDPGTTVVWRWNGQGGGHNVVAEDGDWSSGNPVSTAGTTYERTFDSAGVYRYYCTPHEGLGMKGAVVVGDRGAGAGGESEGLVIGRDMWLFGGGAMMALVSPLVFAAFLRWRQPTPSPEPPGPPEPTRQLEAPTTEEAPEAVPEQELDHHEFDPLGTLSLVLGYFVILALMWVFMYFVEFLGRGPTVIG